MRIKKRQPRTPNRLIFLVGIIIAATLLLAAYHIYSSSRNNNRSSEQVLSQKPAKAAVDGTKKTPKEKDDYTVAPDHPRQLIISKLGIDANILPMGILKDGSLEAPKTAWDVGWYNRSALPGFGLGALLIDGHVNDRLGSPGVFYGLTSLMAGDEMTIQRGDGQTYVYRVIKIDQKPIEHVDMSGMLRSITPGKEGLNLITCGGAYDPSRGTYNDRILVYSERIS